MKREIRRSQLISPYGIGAVVDVNDEGFVVKDISEWQSPRKTIISSKIRQIVGKQLRTFGTHDDFVPVDRFPKWHYCSSCRHLFHWASDLEIEDSAPGCPKNCRDSKAVPMRFVAVCDKGHLSEIDWFNWVHQSSDEGEFGQCSRENMNLSFSSTGQFGGDFDQLVVKCKNCSRERDLKDVGRRFANKFVVRAKKGQECSGKQPWQYYGNAEDCDQRMFIEPRGSSTIYRPFVISALELNGSMDQPDQPSLEVIENPKFKAFCDKIESSSGSKQIAVLEIDEGEHDARIESFALAIGIDDSLLKSLVLSHFRNDDYQDDETVSEGQRTIAQIAKGQSEIHAQEFDFLLKHQNIDSEDLSVSFHDFEHLTASKEPFFGKIGLIRRLREVRCLAGFSRGKGLRTLDADLSGSKDWLPAMEAYGEGIYLELNTSKILKWQREQEHQLNPIIEDLISRYEASFLSEYFDVELTPSFLLVHTLSHLLIRELTLNSGYPSSSLRERIYSNASGQVALLIYATDMDASGTLGGLVEQGRPRSFWATLQSAIRKAEWCSGDPVCRELTHQGLASLNNSSCHCCSLVSETSCVYSNVFLNRLFLIGSGERQEPLGFFKT